jgi:hypothetical protein
MNLAEKFKLINVSEQSIEETKKVIENARQSVHIDERTRLGSMTFFTHVLAMELYLLGRAEDAFYTVQNILPVTQEYLIGDWQKALLTDKKTIDPQWWHSVLPWSRRFREDLMWLSATNNFNGCQTIFSFIDDECKDDDAGYWGKKYYIGLKYIFENKNVPKEFFEEVINNGKKKYCQCSEIVLSILNNNSADVKKYWIILFKTWLDREAKNDWYLAREATFLYHFAAWKGITIDIPEEMLDHIVRFPNELIKK